MADLYQTITDKIVAMIEAGAGEWHMPWHGAGLKAPQNPLSGTRYRGVNVALLWSAAQAKGCSSQLWATYKQWSAAGAPVRKGEKSETVFFWKRLAAAETADDAADDAGDSAQRHLRFVARAYNVFAAEQVEGWTRPASLPGGGLDDCERVAAAEDFFARLGAVVAHGGERAFYAPSRDMIQMPEFARFREAGGYYATLGDEHVHWTGAARRCNREFGQRFGDAAYAFEELVAELGAAFLCAELGFSNEPRPDHAAYIDTWLKVLRADKRAIFTAGSRAQSAVDWLNAHALPGELAQAA